MAKFLITGGHGLIGVTIARKLLEKGHKVTVIDLKDDVFGVRAVPDCTLSCC